jgi:hypothetical protein
VSSGSNLVEINSVLKYANRPIICVSVPSFAFYNETWETNDTNMKMYGIKNKNIPFYLSTGVSNDVNFSGIWFPFYRIKETEKEYSYDMERGWIHKDT